MVEVPIAAVSLAPEAGAASQALGEEEPEQAAQHGQAAALSAHLALASSAEQHHPVIVPNLYSRGYLGPVALAEVVRGISLPAEPAVALVPEA